MPRGDLKKVHIASGAVFSGTLSSCAAVSVDGRLEGHRLEAREIFIGKTGRIKAGIKGESVVVEGIVIGDIEASNRVILMPTARVAGNISTHELIVQKGVLFEGNCIIRNDLQPGSSREVILRAYAAHPET